jgi:hypothetical protein
MFNKQEKNNLKHTLLDRFVDQVKDNPINEILI